MPEKLLLLNVAVCYAFSASTLLVMGQKWHLAGKKLSVCVLVVVI